VYHLHVDPAVDGNCTTTGAHLDPFNRGEKPPCDASVPASCQVGDLSGKHGKISADPFHAEYIDPFASLKEGDAAFFGNRSFVIHYANTTRITCANFAKVDAPVEPGCSQTPSSLGTAPVTAPTGTGVVAPSQSVVPFLGSAMANAAPLSLMAAAAAAALFAL
jgi:hypothetical protein